MGAQSERVKKKKRVSALKIDERVQIPLRFETKNHLSNCDINPFNIQTIICAARNRYYGNFLTKRK
jgi:hypothetical protein